MPQITLILKTEEGLARPREMREAIQAIIDAGLLPSTGMKMTFQVATKDDAENLEDLLDEVLATRSWVIDAEIERKDKRGVKRKSVEKETPLERELRYQTASSA